MLYGELWIINPGKHEGILARISADHTSSSAYCFHYQMHLSLYLEMAKRDRFLHLPSSALEDIEVEEAAAVRKEAMTV